MNEDFRFSQLVNPEAAGQQPNEFRFSSLVTPEQLQRVAPQAQHRQRAASGVLDALEAGWQGSATGLALRRRLPDVVLDAHHAKWYEKLAAGASQMVSELPEMIGGGIAGGVAGGAAGSAVPVIGNAAGAVIGAGAGAFAAPTAIRESLMQAYTKGAVTSSGDFLDRAGIVIKATAKDALIGGVTSGAGALVGKVVAPLAETAVTAGRISSTTAKIATGAATMGTEGAVMTVAPAALEGRLPEPEDFSNAAILMVGMKAAHFASGKLREVYSKTGKTPIEVMADAKADPSIARDLATEGGDIPEAYKPPASETAAADAFPGVKAQEVLDNPFGDTSGPKQKHQLNMRYIDGPEDLRALEARMSEVYKQEFLEQQGGPRAWEETDRLAQRVADLSGASKEFILESLRNRFGSPVDLDVAMAIKGDWLERATIEAAQAVKAVKDAGQNVTDAQKLQALEAIHRLNMVQGDVVGSRAEVGRALSYLKRLRQLERKGGGLSEVWDLYGEKAADTIELPDGSKVKATEFATKGREWLERVKKDSELIDVAVQCSLGLI